MDWLKLMNHPIYKLSEWYRAMYDNPVYKQMEIIQKMVSPTYGYFGSPHWKYYKGIRENLKEITNTVQEWRHFVEENALDIKETKTAVVVETYRPAIQEKYKINVQFESFFFDCFGDMNIWDFLEKSENEGFIIGCLVDYAKKRKEKFDKFVKDTGGVLERNEPKNYRELFTVEQFEFVENMLLKLEFLNSNGVLLINRKEHYKIAAFCDALIYCSFVDYYPDRVLHGLFMERLGLRPVKLKRDSKNFQPAKRLYIRGIEKEQRT